MTIEERSRKAERVLGTVYCRIQASDSQLPDIKGVTHESKLELKKALADIDEYFVSVSKDDETEELIRDGGSTLADEPPGWALP